ncbi:MAG: phosphatase PAP2 family protein [Caulobacteraceae bacterium]
MGLEQSANEPATGGHAAAWSRGGSARLAAVIAAARGELALVAALLIVAVAVLGVLGLTDEVRDGHTVRFDEGLILMLRRPGDITHPIGPAWLKLGVIDLTSLGSITDLAIIVIAVAGLFVALRRWRQAALLVFASLSGLLLVNVFKVAVGRTRPPLVLHVVAADNASFPSGHAALSAVVFLTLATLTAHFAIRRRVAIYALATGLVLTLMVGMSRIYLGVHWPTDVIAGWAIGAGWAMLWWMIAWLFEHRRKRPLDN